MDSRMLPPPPQPPRIEILENPKQRGMRFRYECEGRSAGSIPGERTSTDRKTWPSIRIVNYSGEVTVRVSLVSKDPIPRPHPHSLVGKDCVKGICSVRVNPETQMTATFSNLGIQCVKRKEVAEALRLRHSLNVDPYRSHQSSDPQAADIDLNIVRLCFEGFINQGNSHLVLQPVLSNPIFDKKATCSAMLRICRVDRSYGGCKGGDEVYLLCDKVQKDDISVCFYEKGTGWEAYGEFSPTDVHRQVAIVFRTPAFRDPNITEATKVHFLLKRTSDGQTSDAKDFTYLPSQHVQPQVRQNAETLKRRYEGDPSTRQHVREFVHKRFTQQAKVTKQDPGQSSDGSFPPLTFPETAFPSVAPPRPGLMDSNALDNFLNKFPPPQQFPNMKVQRMDPPPQYHPMPQRPESYMFQTQPSALNQSSFVPVDSRPNFASAVSQPNFASAVSQPNFASAAPQSNFVSVASRPSFTSSANQQSFASAAVQQSSYAQALHNTISPISAQQGMMTQPHGRSVAHQPPRYELPATAMPLCSTMQQGTIAASPASVQSPDLADLGAVGEDINLESINTASFADIDTDLDKGMNNLSIEPDTSFSDLIKTEPHPTTGFPNTIPPPTFPTPIVHPPSPQQYPPRQQYVPEEVVSITGLLPSLDFPDGETSFPSFDLNEGAQLPSATQNVIDDLVTD